MTQEEIELQSLLIITNNLGNVAESSRQVDTMRQNSEELKQIRLVVLKIWGEKTLTGQ